MAERRDLFVDQGSFSEVVLGPFRDPNGAPYSLVGATARMQYRESVAAGVALLTLTTENGGIVLDEAAGKATLRFSEIATSALVVLRGVYDLEVVLADGKCRRVMQGAITFDREVTR